MPASNGSTGPCAENGRPNTTGTIWTSGRTCPQAAVGHGRVAFLLLAIAKNGGITPPNVNEGRLRGPRTWMKLILRADRRR
ncbi:hypothetical protein L537_4410 [Bordetella hinzii 1277]|nr:hypothetical protein L537_4410 [Bordetella hinzii 1277]